MNPNIEKIKTHLTEITPDSVLEMLYGYYREWNIPEPEQVKACFAQLESILGKLPLREEDEVWYRVCDLCTEYQKMAFVDGVAIGVKLAAELESHG